MSFIDNSLHVLDRAEASLQQLIADAVAAKAYTEIATIAAMAEAVAAISFGRSGSEKRTPASVPDLDAAASSSADDMTTAVGPSWMRAKT